MSLPIEIDSDSPYFLGYTNDFDDGSSELVRVNFVYTPSLGDIPYTVKVDDTIWNIASQFYPSSQWWWLIMEANDIIDPFILDIGSILVIPDFKTIQSQL